MNIPELVIYSKIFCQRWFCLVNMHMNIMEINSDVISNYRGGLVLFDCIVRGWNHSNTCLYFASLRYYKRSQLVSPVRLYATSRHLNVCWINNTARWLGGVPTFVWLHSSIWPDHIAQRYKVLHCHDRCIVCSKPDWHIEPFIHLVTLIMKRLSWEPVHYAITKRFTVSFRTSSFIALYRIDFSVQ